STWRAGSPAAPPTGRTKPRSGPWRRAAAWRARKSMKNSRATRARAVARCRVTESARSFHQTTNAPITAWARTRTRAATAARRTTRSWPVRQAATTPSATRTMTTEATSRWECSIQGWSSAGGTSRPKQRGQSGQPSPESVARTRPPTAISTKVAAVVTTARRRNGVNKVLLGATGRRRVEVAAPGYRGAGKPSTDQASSLLLCGCGCDGDADPGRAAGRLDLRPAGGGAAGRVPGRGLLRPVPADPGRRGRRHLGHHAGLPALGRHGGLRRRRGPVGAGPGGRRLPRPGRRRPGLRGLPGRPRLPPPGPPPGGGGLGGGGAGAGGG